tara:strand:+ start:743 stop:1321 length:579 start_codon:yes stop_codon:yes gene_type:complete
MKITKSQLKQIIKEELTKALREAKPSWFPIPKEKKPERQRPHLRRPPPRPRPLPSEEEDDPSPRGSTYIDYSMEEADQLELPMTHEPYGGRTKQFGDYTVTYVESRKEWSPRWRMGIRAFEINGKELLAHGDYSRLPNYHEVQEQIWARLRAEEHQKWLATAEDEMADFVRLRGGEEDDLSVWLEGLFGREQ